MAPEHNGWSRGRLLLVAAAIYILALGLRLAFLHGIQDNPLYQFLILDERSQHEVAAAIARDALPPNAYFKAPFFAYFLGTIYKIIGIESLSARYIQVVIVSLIPVLIFLIACKLFDLETAILAGVLASIYWTAVFYSAELLDVSLACVFYLLLAYVLIAVNDARPWKWLLGGLLLGLGAITRPNILAFGPVLGVLIIILSRRHVPTAESDGPHDGWWRTGLFRTCLLVFGAATAIAPVTIRNWVVAKEPLLISAYGGVNLMIANNPTSDGKNAICPRLDITVRHPGLDFDDPWVKWDLGWQACYLHAAQYLGSHPTYAEVERFLIRETLSYIRHQPGKFLTDTFKRFCFLFNAYEYPSNKDLNQLRGQSRLLGALSWLHFGMLASLGVLGTVLALRRRPRTRAMVYYVAMILSLALPGILFVVNARYRLPVSLLLLPMVAYAVFELARMVRGPVQWRRLGACAIALSGLTVLSNVNVFGYRPPYHEYILFSYAGACGAVGRDDLMAEAIEEIERALADDSYPHMLHPFAMTCLFDYYLAHGNVERAEVYARRMLERGEPLDERRLPMLVTVLAQTGQRDWAQRCLKVLVNRAAHQANPQWAGALLTYGRTFKDRPVLELALRQFEALCRQRPAESSFRERVAEVKGILEQLGADSGTDRK